MGEAEHRPAETADQEDADIRCSAYYYACAMVATVLNVSLMAMHHRFNRAADALGKDYFPVQRLIDSYLEELDLTGYPEEESLETIEGLDLTENLEDKKPSVQALEDIKIQYTTGDWRTIVPLGTKGKLLHTSKTGYQVIAWDNDVKSVAKPEQLEVLPLADS